MNDFSVVPSDINAALCNLSANSSRKDIDDALWKTREIIGGYPVNSIHPLVHAAHMLLVKARRAYDLEAMVNNPHTEEFLPAVKLEAAHQRDRWGDAHGRGKSAENWFWLVGYLAGKCLRAVITGDREKALHHTISSAAALANWYEAIKRDTTGTGLGQDNDIKPVEIARFEEGKSLDGVTP